MTNERAKELLEENGIECECEPAWVEEGQKPDFYCTGLHEFWCEVKTLGPTNDFKSLGNAFEELRNRVSHITLPGEGMAYVSDTLDQGDAKRVTSLLERALLSLNNLDGPDQVVALVPSKPIHGKFVRFTMSTEDHSRVEVHSNLSESGTYELPDAIFPVPDEQVIRVQNYSEREQELPAGEVVVSSSGFRIAIVAWRNERPFRLITVAPTMATQLSNVERIRAAVAEANSQFKNAVSYKEAPCLLLIFQDGIDVPDERIVVSALYGDLKYTFSRHNSKDGQLRLDSNGAWNPNKNKTTSAIAYVRNGGPLLLIHNFWALRPFPQCLFPSKQIVMLPDGTFPGIGEGGPM